MATTSENNGYFSVVLLLVLSAGDIAERYGLQANQSVDERGIAEARRNHRTGTVYSAHYIREKVVSEIVLESMQRVFWYVQSFEKDFARKQMTAFGEETKKELSEKRRELAQAKKRVKEIDSLIQRIYEDNVVGKISDERFATMSMAFEEEQQMLKSAIPEMETYLESETDKTDSLQRFIDRVKRVTQLTELTPEIVHEFIEKM